ncbi:sulfotransferase family protein [Ectopseudomonas mendocina]|uniref:Sulfotransferase family protein n=1 Tax=Ectopseudomonas mendocina TaxID=300 RepID=A0ABD7RWJ8_ECTME|nr:sulfotransferase [Pseudomonas mendocina]TRO14976.1 sulfotransferase family protein [Pseudomonas mendocina]TRO18363.1 sulfotransferase family protein [Pseudomonas mendocina]
MNTELHHWLPIRVVLRDQGWFVDWCWFGDTPLSEPFYRDSVQRAMRLPFNQALRRETSLDELLEWQRHSPGVAPRAFIHHASRCGSTLIAQLLASIDRHIVVSEPAPLDSLLRAHFFDPGAPARQAAWVGALLSAFGQPRRGLEQDLVVKLDSWNIFEAPFLRAIYPDTPWIFLYRDPLEIVVSQLRQPGTHMVPGMIGPSLLAFSAEESATMTPLEFVARCIGRTLQQGLTQCLENGGIAVNYSELPEAVWGRLAPLFDVREGDLERLRQAAGRDAKQPGMSFVADSQRKREAASEQVREAVERWAREPYQALEALRLSQV